MRATSNNAKALVFRIILTLLAGYGLADGWGLLRGHFDCCGLVYFTDVSNLLGFLYFLAAVVFGLTHRSRSAGAITFLPRLKGCVTLGLALTLLVNQFVLSGTPFHTTANAAGAHFDVANFLSHYLVPLMAIFDAIIFDETGWMRPSDPWVFEIIPCVYFIYVLIRAQVGGPINDGRYYPYFFLDVHALGFIKVTMCAVAMAAGVLVLGYIVYWSNRRLAQKAN